jgi:pimeloyl-ACP methyl ester carboxylesterase
VGFEIAALAIALSLLLYALILVTRGLLVTCRLFASFNFPKAAGNGSPLCSGEQVEFESRDGILLEGRLFIAERPTRKAVIFCPEAGSDWNALSRYGCYLPQLGLNVLTFNFRCFQEELPATRVRPWVTKEDVEDVRAAIRFIEERCGSERGEIGLLGISRGAASALCAAAEEQAVGAVAADGAFDTRWMVEDCMRKWTPRYLPIRKLPEFLYPFLSLIVIKWSERQLQQRFASVLNSFKDARHVAFLFIHGKKDRYIPESQVLEMYRRARSARARNMWIVPDAGHNESAIARPADYAERVSQFFHDAMPEQFRCELETNPRVEALQ